MESKETSDALNHIEASVLDALADPVVVVAKNHRVLVANRPWIDAGLATVGAEIYDGMKLSEANKKLMREALGEVLEGSSRLRAVELDHQTRWGEIRVVYNIGESHHRGQSVAVVQRRQITDLRRAQQDARKAKAFFSSLLEHMPQLIVVRDAETGKVILVNRAVETYFAVGRDAAVGKSWAELVRDDASAGLHEQRDRAAIAAAVAGAPATIAVAEETFQTPLGERTFLHSRIPVHEEHEVKYLLTMAADVTEEKANAAALALAQSELEISAQEARDEAERNGELARELEAKLDVIDAQRAQIVELSVPILEVHENVIAVPIVGTIDRQRSSVLADQLTRVIVERQPEYVILDLTGAYALDAESAQSLLKVLAAVRLLGAEGMLSGIRGQLAQTIVDLNLDLAQVATERTLKDAIVRCMDRMEQLRQDDANPLSWASP